MTSMSDALVDRLHLAHTRGSEHLACHPLLRVSVAMLTEPARQLARETHWRPRHGELRVFESRWLEAFTRSPPIVPFLWVPVAVAFCLDRATFGWEFLARFGGGWLAWSALEYLMHRLLFHARVRGEVGKGVVFLVHGHHHAHPWDEGRLVATWWQAASALALLFAVASLFPHRLDIFAGSLCAYLAYEAVHHRIHHAQGGGRWMRALRAHHLRHHHAAEAGGPYGIGSRLFDWLLRS